MITIVLHGDLQKYGRRFDMRVSTPLEAWRGLLAQIDGLKSHIRNGRYQVRFRGKDMCEDNLQAQMSEAGSGVLHIVPRVEGAGKNGGIIQTVVGVVLIVVGAFTSWAGGGTLVAAGISMVAGGVAQMLTKMPDMNMNQASAEASKNTSFTNLGNTTAQGQPVPLAYGLIYCGSRVLSQGVESRRLSNEEIDGTEEVITSSLVLATSLIYALMRKSFLSLVSTLPAAQQYALMFARKKQESAESLHKKATDLAKEGEQGIGAIKSYSLHNTNAQEQADWCVKLLNYLFEQDKIRVVDKDSLNEVCYSHVQGLQNGLVTPGWLDLSFTLKRNYFEPTAATAPNGQKYNIDLNDDSVRARNYTVSEQKKIGV